MPGLRSAGILAMSASTSEENNDEYDQTRSGLRRH